MLIHALVASIRTCPKPTILPILHSFDKVLAYFICRRPRIAMFTQYYIAQLFFVPIFHPILLLLFLLLFFLLVSTIRV